MNQLPASIVMVAASICAFAATSRPQETLSGILGMAALGLGLWGGLALLAACTREMELQGNGQLGNNLANRLAMGGRSASSDVAIPGPLKKNGTVSSAPLGAVADDVALTPEVAAQVTLVAHMRGQDRRQVIDEVLRQHLPRYTSQRAA